MFISCGSKPGKEPADEESGYEIDISKFEVSYGQGTSYDKKTFTFIDAENPSENGSINIWLEGKGKDFADYNCVRIKYAAQNYGFFFQIKYKDGNGKEITEEFYCPSNKTEFIVPLNKELLPGILSFIISGCWNQNVNIQFESITLLNCEDTGPSPTYTSGSKIKDTDAAKQIDDSVSAWDFLPKMGVGFQYTVLGGYTFGIDFGVDGSYAWVYPIESKELIHEIAAKGFKTLRLQVAGSFHVMDANFTLDTAFMKKLKQVVDWAIDEGMYVIICEGCCSYYYPAEVGDMDVSLLDSYKEKNDWCENHLFGAGVCINKKYKDKSGKYLTAFWTQICEAFNNSYDEHLVFEFINEPIDVMDKHNWHPDNTYPQCSEDVKVLNELNQAVLDTIRASGGNNAKRYLMVPTLGQDAPAVSQPGFELPKDFATNKLIVAVHNYPMGNTPPDENGNGGDIKTSYSKKVKEIFVNYLQQADEVCFKKNIPLAITETGCSRWTPLVDRMECMKDLMTEVTKDGRNCMVSIHENCSYDTYDNFGYFNKQTNTWYDSEYIDLIIKMAAKQDTSKEDKYIEDNKTKVELLTGKNLLEEFKKNPPVNLGNWNNEIGFKDDDFANRLPETFKLEIKYEIPATFVEGTDWSTLLVYYYDAKWNQVPYANASNLLSGGKYDTEWNNISINKSLSSGEIVIQFDSTMSQNMEFYGLNLMGINLILDSVMIVE